MKVAILTTGGTIEKTYDERDGSLRNFHTILPRMLSTLRLPDLEVSYEQVVFKDSLEMTAGDRARVLEATRRALLTADAVLILTDHDCVDYATVGRHAQLIIDTRNAMRAVQEGREKIRRA